MTKKPTFKLPGTGAPKPPQGPKTPGPTKPWDKTPGPDPLKWLKFGKNKKK
ncbi:MAG: hypothetical protein O2992_05165 [Gemmatimonadetes bacterium]|jgi:hypothetical protein|nr:hypothetical protein [Gemmatimonadota bacterium]